jgi:phospholipid-binding lipoprotein MlaA
MKVVCPVYFLLALWLVMIPGPCTGSPSSEAAVSTSPSDEANFMAVAADSFEPSAGAEPVESSDPLQLAVSAGREDDPDQTLPTEVSPPSSQPEEPAAAIADPLEPVNRAFFHFNDKLYFWVFKPVASGYKAVIPEDGRIGVHNFFSNVTTPVRLVNCLLQAKFKGAGNETVRFVLNTTLGIAGFFDPARKAFKIERQEADFGQTLGIWGMGPAFYIDWPILGPSNMRDTVGYVGDLAFDPRTYLAYYFVIAEIVNAGTWGLDKVNETSLTLGEYENLKKAALDPYIALREAYAQYRQNKIRKGRNGPKSP